MINSWVEFEKIEQDEQEWIQKTEFIQRIFRLLERVVDHYIARFNEISEKHPNLAKHIIEQVTHVLSSATSLVYQSSITKNYGCEQVAFLLIKIYDKLKKLLDYNDKKYGKGNLLEQIILQNDEGVDHLNEKVLETNHPYERGKVINFEQLNFPGAIAISVEFDKRC